MPAKDDERAIGRPVPEHGQAVASGDETMSVPDSEEAMPVDEARLRKATTPTPSQHPPAELTQPLRSVLSRHVYLRHCHVVGSPGDLPMEVQSYLLKQGLSPNKVKGVYTRGGTYLVAGNVSSVEDGIRTALHEVVGHEGVRALLADRFEPVMRQLYQSFPRQHEAWTTTAIRYGYLDTGTDAGQVAFAEELTAYMAENDVELGEFDMIKAEIRAQMRELIPELPVTDLEVKALIQRSRESLIMRHGSPDAAEEVRKRQALRLKAVGIIRDAMARDGKGGPDALSLALHRDGSRVLDADGIPCRLYHGAGREVDRVTGNFWGATTPELANDYAEMRGDQGAAAMVIPFYANIQRPFDGDALKDIRTTFETPDGLSTAVFAEALIQQGGVVGKAADALRDMGRELRQLGRQEESGPTYSPQDFWYNARSFFGSEGAELIERMFARAGFDGVRYTEQGHLTYGAFHPAQLHFLDQGASPRGWQPDRYHGEGPQTERPAFKQWFGESKMVDGEGRPAVMYHSTAGDITAFQEGKIRPLDLDAHCNGFWFSSARDTSPATQAPTNVMPVYLAVQNPAPYPLVAEVFERVQRDGKLRPEARSRHDEVRYRLQEMGYDGFVFTEPTRLSEEQREAFKRNGQVSLTTNRGHRYQLRRGWHKVRAFEEVTDEITTIEFEGPEGKRGAINLTPLTDIEVVRNLVMEGAILVTDPDAMFEVMDQVAALRDGVVESATVGEARLTRRIDTRTYQDLRETGEVREVVDYVEDGIGHVTSYESLDDFERMHDERVVAAFRPEQIKSAIGNRGSFLRNHPDIRFDVAPGVADHPTKTPAFVEWFAQSKLHDHAGEPLVLFHGTANEEFTVFNPSRAGTQQRADWGQGIYLTPQEMTAERYRREAVMEQDPVANAAFERYEALVKPVGGVTADLPEDDRGAAEGALREFQAARRRAEGAARGRVMPLYVRMVNPWVQPYTHLPDPDLGKRAREAGHDGIVVLTPEGTIDEVVAFEANQLKSAVDNTGAFDRGNADIRFDLAGNVLHNAHLLPITQQPAFNAWFGDSHVVDGSGEPLVVYHGSDEGDFPVFSMQRKTNRYTTLSETQVQSQGASFSPEPADASEYGEHVRAFYLSVKRPFPAPGYERPGSQAHADALHVLAPLLYADGEGPDARQYIDIDNGISRMEVDPEGAWLGEYFVSGMIEWGPLDHPDVVSRLKALGYDGARAIEDHDVAGYSWFVVDPRQIKSAVDNAGTFDPNNPDIRFALRQASIEERFGSLSRDEAQAYVSGFLANEIRYRAGEIKALDVQIAAQPDDLDSRRQRQAAKDAHSEYTAALGYLLARFGVDLLAGPMAGEVFEDGLSAAVSPSMSERILEAVEAISLEELRDDIDRLEVEGRYQEAEMVAVVAERIGHGVQSSRPLGALEQQLVGVKARTLVEAAQAESFKRWFGASRIVDDEGIPKVVYHGSENSFDVFDPDWIGLGHGAADFGEGFYFADLPAASATYAAGAGGNIRPVFLNIQHPADMDVLMRDDVQAAMDDDMGFTSLAEVLEELGYDGVAIEREGGTEYVALRPEQIRSAFTPGAGELRQRAFERASDERSTAFQRWFDGSRVIDEQGEPLLVYHGTASNFSRFRAGRGGAIFFTPDADAASAYAMEAVPSDDVSSANVMPAYLALKKPLVIDATWAKENLQDEDGVNWDALDNVLYEAEEKGYDGAILRGLNDFAGVQDLEGGSTRRIEKAYDQYVVFRPEQIKSRFNAGTYDATNPDIRFSFAGPAALTADTFALEEAEARLAAGADPESVRQQTGWFQGGDSKWRFEIDDSSAKLAPGFANETATWGELRDIHLHTFLQDQGRGIQLGDVIDHPRLFAAYPQLVGLNLSVAAGADTQGAYHSGSEGVPPSIQLGRDLPMRDALSVILHETQHAIQRLEGFATGGSPSKARHLAAMAANRELVDADARFRELGKAVPPVLEAYTRLEGLRLTLLGVHDIDWKAPDAPRQLREVITPAQQLRYTEAQEAYYAAIDNHGGFNNPDIKALIDAGMARAAVARRTDLDEGQAYRYYERLSGEIEARNVQARLSMSEGQRQAMSPQMTQDVSDADAVVIVNGTEMASVPANGTKAYHGSPYRFERFSLDAVNSGEGNQVYGYGLYFGSNIEVARSYQQALSSNDPRVDGRPMGMTGLSSLAKDAIRMAQDGGQTSREAAIAWLEARREGQPFSLQRAIDDAITELSRINKIVDANGALYEVTLAPSESEWLDWDRAIDEQSHTVLDRLRGAGLELTAARGIGDEGEPQVLRGADLYRTLCVLADEQTFGRYGPMWDLVKDDPDRLNFTMDQIASRYLNAIGIPGLRYEDEGSRDTDRGKTHNYVLFDDALVSIDDVRFRLADDALPDDGVASSDERPDAYGKHVIGQAAMEAHFVDLVPKAEPGREGIKSYHGSSKLFERFSLSAMGTGEGNHAFGYGHYVASIREVGERYREAGALYDASVTASDDELLNWDAPINEQSEAVQRRLTGLPHETRRLIAPDAYGNHPTGGAFYLALADYFAGGRQRVSSILEGVPGQEGMRDASAELMELGIPGLSYLDKYSRHAGRGSRNYVVFSDDVVEIDAVHAMQVAESSRRYRVPSHYQGKASPDQLALALETLDEIGRVDPYATLETRPGTNDKQRELGRSALHDLHAHLTSRFKRMTNGKVAPDEEVSLLGASLARDIVSGAAAQLLGQTVNSPADLAALAQVYRDPRFETLRFILARGNVVVGESAVTSRLPATVSVGDDVVERLRNAMQEAGADGYYLVHNHPSGYSDPSSADIRLTVRVAEQVNGFRGHVIIDYNEYSVIDSDGQCRTIHAPEFEGRDWQLEPTQPHSALGVKIDAPKTLAELAKRLNAKEEHALLIGTGASHGEVTLVTSVPDRYLDYLRANRFDPAVAANGVAAIRQLLRASGSGGYVFLVPPASAGDDLQKYGWLMQTGLVRDVVSATGISFTEDINDPITRSVIETKSRPMWREDVVTPFQRWFAGSRVVDESGQALTVFHGTEALDFSAFEEKGINEGFYFSPTRSLAEGFAGPTGRVIEAHLAIHNPIDLRGKSDAWLDFHGEGLKQQLLEQGYDGAIITEPEGDFSDGTETVYIAFHSHQIKSATQNRGSYDPANPDIRLSFANEQANWADRYSLNNAKRALHAGFDAEVVRQQTGWHQGVDGKWRFEIDDGQATLLPMLSTLWHGRRPEVEIQSLEYLQHESGRYSVTLRPVNAANSSGVIELVGIDRDVLEAVLPNSVVAAIDAGEGVDEWGGLLPGAGLTIQQSFSYRGLSALALDQVLDHPRLFSAYPQLRTLMVKVAPSLGASARIERNESDGLEYVVLGRGEPLGSLLHELQVAIQSATGFAKGGSAVQSPVREDVSRNQMQRVRAEAHGLYEGWRELGKLTGGVDEPEWLDAEMELRQRFMMRATRSVYDKLAGEADAGNAQPGQELSVAERQQTEPLTAGTPPEDSVAVVFDGQPEAADGPRPNNASLLVTEARAFPGSDAFRRWFGRSVVVDEQGQPLKVFRGEHGLRDTFGEFHTRASAITFSNSEIASDYALNPNDNRDIVFNGRVMPVYLSIQRPAINRPDDPFIEMSEVIEALGWDKAHAMALEMADWIENTGNWIDGYADRYGSVAALLAANPDALADLYLQAYPVFDSPKYTGWFRAAGFDGAVHGGSGLSAGEPEFKIFSQEQARSALDGLGYSNEWAFGPGGNEIRLSFAGEKARIADRLNLEYAKRAIAAGMSPGLVMAHTGWERGADGQWRFEIDDSTATMAFGEASSSNPDAFMDWVDEASHRDLGIPLSQVLIHPELYAAYPQLAAYRVKVVAHNAIEGSAALDRVGRRILMVDPFTLKAREDGVSPALSVLIHEIQHAIQHIEGFAQGGHPTDMGRVMDDAACEGLTGSLDRRYRSEQVQSEVAQMDALREQWQGRVDVPEVVVEELEGLRFSAAAQELTRVQEKTREMKADRAFGGTAYTKQELFEGYKRLAGEVEARNAQGRIAMSETERKKTPAEQTEDVTRARQLLVDSDGNHYLAPIEVTALPLSRVDTLNGCVVNATRCGELIQQVATEMLELLSDAGHHHGWMDGGCRMFAEALRDWSDGKIVLGVTSADGKTASHVMGVLALSDDPESPCVLIDADGLASHSVMLEKLDRLESSPGEKVIGIGDLADQLAQSLPIDEAVVDQAVQSLEVGLGSFSQWAKGLQSELTADLAIGFPEQIQDAERAVVEGFVAPGGP